MWVVGSHGSYYCFQRNPIVKSIFLSGWWEPPPPLLRHLAIAHDCSSLSAAQLCIYIYISSLRIMGISILLVWRSQQKPCKKQTVKTPLFWRVCPMILRDKHIYIYHSETNPQLKSSSSQSRPPVGLSVCVRDTLRVCR